MVVDEKEKEKTDSTTVNDELTVEENGKQKTILATTSNKLIVDQKEAVP